MLFAEVIIPLAIPKTYTYAIPPSMESILLPGMRVEVAFGQKKRYAGIVKSVSDTAPTQFTPKNIIQILDSSPVVFQQQLQLWNWISTYYMCSEGEVMAAALPAQLKLSSETILVYNDEYGDDFSDLDDQEYLVAEGLLLKKELKLDEVQGILDISRVYPVVKRLLDKRLCFASESIKEKYIPKKEKRIFLHAKFQSEENLAALLNDWNNRAPKQLDLLLAFLHLSKTKGEVSQSDLLQKSGASAAQLKALIDKEILQTRTQHMDRIHFAEKQVKIDFELSPYQQDAFQQLKSVFLDKEVCLLHGVTSSGKTLLYIKMIEEQIASGNQVLYLLPEIALTAQIIRRLEKHFGGYIAIYHSKFNPNERVELWNKVRTGEIRVVLGARSSIFLPFSRLSLIIVDEEHDSSFKQYDPAPRYSAKDAALYYARLFQAKVILGSATPSLESYAQAQMGKYGLVQLFERYGNIEMPEILTANVREVVDGKSVLHMITPALKLAIEETLSAKKQVILFQNRRGYTPYKICGTCGHIPHCDHCDVTLTYHKLTHKLQCHYCGKTYSVLPVCDACGSTNWVERKFGTEKVEEELQLLFPNHSIARMDVDTIRGKNAHDEMIRNLEAQRIDILVGTQMVVKGLDFEHVALVGILDADGLLGFTDFRVNERAFQLMEQVSGRAGRKGDRGKVIIQTTNPNNPIIQLVISHDYAALFEQEMNSRKIFNYPPFSRIIQLYFKHGDKQRANAAAEFIASRLKPVLVDNLIGPAEPVVNRVKNKYIYELMLKLPRDGSGNSRIRNYIQQALILMQNDGYFKSVHVQVDVDPL